MAKEELKPIDVSKYTITETGQVLKMNKNKCFLNGGRGSGKTFRLLCETYENKIADLEFSVRNLRKDKKELEEVLPKLDKENDELKYKISLLLSCKDCPENKGGFICVKEYENKCLAQKIQYIKELKEENKVLAQNLEDTEIINKALEKENAELKEFVNAPHTKGRKTTRADYIKTVWDLSKQLTKAKELLVKWVELYKPKLEGYPITPIQEQTEQFLNSEVEK